MLQSKAGYIDARPLTASSAKPLATHGRTIHWVIADIGGRRDHVGSYLESRHRPRRMFAELTQIEFFVAPTSSPANMPSALAAGACTSKHVKSVT
jgi:hypothetical protein